MGWQSMRDRYAAVGLIYAALGSFKSDQLTELAGCIAIIEHSPISIMNHFAQ